MSEEQQTTIPTPTTQAIVPLREERMFALQQREAKALAASTMIPKEYQGNIPNVIIAMEISHRLGASVFAVMQNLDIIHGRPSWRSSFLIGTVNACGRFTPLRFRFEGKEGTSSWGCRAVAKDRESGEVCEGTLITIKMAETEGWASKSGSKWKTMPEQMLRYRAAAFWTRVYAPELSLGMHTVDEQEDMAGTHATVVQGKVSTEADRITRAAERNRSMLPPATPDDADDGAGEAECGVGPEDDLDEALGSEDPQP